MNGCCWRWEVRYQRDVVQGCAFVSIRTKSFPRKRESSKLAHGEPVEPFIRCNDESFDKLRMNGFMNNFG